MARGESAFDTLLAPGTIQGSRIDDGLAAYNVEVFAGAESSTDEPAFGVLGSGGRPLAPSGDGVAEMISARTADGLPIVAMRDKRIEQARAATPAEGTIYLAGYHGAELRFDVVSGETRSTAALTDAQGSDLVLDDQGVRVPTSDFVQGDPDLAQDLLLAQPAIDLLAEMGPIVLALAAAVNTLAPGSITPTQIANLTTKLGPYLAAGSPNAPTTRAPGVRGAPGA